jgi:hypothetical protein
MHYTIQTTPRRFELWGKSSAVERDRIPETGMRLMNELWQTVKASGTPTTGINHWVYLPESRMFVGVELQPNASPPPALEPLAFELQRYLEHLHVGPYHALPAKWQALRAELAKLGETTSGPCLEIYGHHCDDEAKQETRVLIGLG